MLKIVISVSYLLCLCSMACSGYLSWQYVSSMNHIVLVGDGMIGIMLWLGAPSTHSMSNLSLARHWHCGELHLHCRSHYGIVESNVWPF